MVQNNTRACFENQFPRIKKAHTIIEFGEPIDIKSLPKEERKFIGNYVRDIINEIQLKMKNWFNKSLSIVQNNVTIICDLKILLGGYE